VTDYYGNLTGQAYLAIIFAVDVVIGLFAGWLANEKGHSQQTWVLLGILFGPIALAAIGFAPARAKASPPPAPSRDDLPL